MRALLAVARVAAAYTLVLLASACAHQAGRDFVHMPDSELVFNRTTRADIVARSGPPLNEKSTTETIRDPSGKEQRGEHQIIRYSYYDSTAEGRAGARPLRSATYYFWNDALVGYTYTSSFQRDATFFDDANLKQVKRGATTEKAVIDLLGPPSGRLVYPMTVSPGVEIMEYLYNGGAGRITTVRKLQVFLGPDRTVRDYRYDNESTEAPPISVPYVVTTPVKK